MTALQVQLVNNNVLSVDYKVAKCPVKYRSNFEENRDFYVLPLHGKFDIILGQPFLESRNPNIDWVQKTVTMSKMHKAGGRAGVLRSVICTSMHVLPSLTTSSTYVYKQPAEDSERTKKLKKLNTLSLDTMGSVVNILQNEVYTLACYKHNGKPGIRPCVNNYGSAPDRDF